MWLDAKDILGAVLVRSTGGWGGGLCGRGSRMMSVPENSKGGHSQEGAPTGPSEAMLRACGPAEVEMLTGHSNGELERWDVSSGEDVPAREKTQLVLHHPAVTLLGANPGDLVGS